MRRGLYRILGMGGLPNDVRIDDDGITVPLEEALYRARGYEPPVDGLPWRDDYFIRQASAELTLLTEAKVDNARKVDHTRTEPPSLKKRGASIFSRYETR
jgi:hypothetical protein